jgi:integrase
MKPYIEIGNDCYEIRWTEGGRSRARSTGTTDFEEASRALRAFVAKSVDNRSQRGSARPYTVAQALDDYVSSHVEKKVIGKETQIFSIDKFKKAMGAKNVADLRPSDIEGYVAARRRGVYGVRPAANGTIIRELGVLKAGLHKAARAKRISHDDIPEIEMPPAPEARDRWLTHEEADRLLLAAKGEFTGPKDFMPRAYRFTVLALATWGRKAAIEGIRVDQVDLERRIIHLNPPGRQQTPKRRPIVPIPDWALPAIMRMVATCKDGWLLDHPGCVRSAFDVAVKRAKLKDVTAHTLRHTGATWAAQLGVSLYQIAGVLGDRTATVEKNYLHHCPDHLRGAVNATRMEI